MKLQLIWVGKTRNQNWLALQEEYAKRLRHFVSFDIVEVRDGDREIEGKRILDKLNQSSFVCLLDAAGKAMDSPGFAGQFEKWQNAGMKEISFIIGGADGVSAEVRERADAVLSLSFLTFTHEMARVVMLEQIYRAYTIIKGYPYQK
ncbi:MAG: 23S rRNA (pseudouridine(1915)-N(3))-methyltransferase RlmH [Acidobacteria bacterium]|nr:23S rRNA (pseudouridine(1915)-N(3))-methyltransferase RlmH [Acidobacteriota bacterium]